MLQESSRQLLLSLPQPFFILGGTLLTAYTTANQLLSPGEMAAILVISTIVFILLIERFTPKRSDWKLNGREFAEDMFWLVSSLIIWVPILEEYYDTPIAAFFSYIRETSSFPIQLTAESTLGLFFVAMFGVFLVEFIGYWVHRLQHRFMFFWRTHATHHHITKMSVARANRTHPLEFLLLNLGTVIVLALFGASSEVAGIILVFRLMSVHFVHANLPLVSGVYGWLFTTPDWHQLHHSCNKAESDTNFGCTVILWDRLFGTFKGANSIERLGNGTGKPLSLATQFLLPFRSNKTIRSL